jgi:ribosomal-protein-alanine N-acetyltransferase
MDLKLSRFQFPGSNVAIKRLDEGDRNEFLALTQASRTLHAEWIQPPLDDQDFEALFQRTKEANFIALAVLEGPTYRLAGLITLSQIFYGPFQSAYMGYWLGEGYAGRGVMTEAMRLALHFALQEIALHRLEANIQPGNLRSIALVKRVGFVLEGYSQKYLNILGEWRDHERWAIHKEIWPERDATEDCQPRWLR